MYAQDYDECLPLILNQSASLTWWKVITPYVGGGEMSLTNSDYYKDKARGAIYHCPSESYVTAGVSGSQGPVYSMGSHLKNKVLSSDTIYVPYFLVDIPHPATCLMVADGYYDAPWGLAGIAVTGPQEARNGISYRHTEGANILFVDGHVSWQRKPIPDSCFQR
jgi:prepilin-type processing-associated H-X9-DG protein